MTASSLPESIGPYRVLRRLGRGGMAEVYVAEDEVTGEEHALKLMLRGTSHTDRFNQEYEALTRLNHPSVVRVYQYGFHEGAPWFSMEHIAGEPLQQWVRRFGKPGAAARTREVMRAGAVLADAVAYVHDRGLIHRDLKGSNVLVLPDGRVKLLDFGTAHIRDGVRDLTRPGEFIGTLAYASPEQFKGQAFDHRVDLYALGVLLYRLITGQRPFVADDPAVLARRIVKEPPQPPSAVVDDLPTGLDALILRLLAKKPDKRPDSAREVAARLEEILGEPLGLPGWGAAIRRDRLAGRETILRQLRRQLDADGPPLLLLGPVGSDRGQIGAALVADLVADGAHAITIACERQPDVGAVVTGLLRAVDAGDAPADRRVQQAVGALRLFAKRGAEVALRNRAGLMAASSSVLVGMLRDRGPHVLHIEDAHAADAATLDLLGHLREHARKGGLPARWLIGADPHHTETLAASQRHFPDAIRVPLPPLDVPSVALRVGAMLDRRPPPIAMAYTLHAASGGQPGWVEALVAQLVEDGRIRLIGEDGNRIEWEVDDELAIPAGARQRIAEDIRRLPTAHQRALHTLALAGSPCRIDTLATALAWQPDEVAAMLEPLARAGWVDRDGDAVHLTEPLIAWVVTEDLDAARLHAFVHGLGVPLSTESARREHVEVLLALDRPLQALVRAIEAANHHLDHLETVEALDVLGLIAPLRDTPTEVDAAVLSSALLLHAQCLLMVRPVDPELARSLAAARKHARDPRVSFGVQLVRARLQRTLGHFPNHLTQLRAAAEAATEIGDPRLTSMVACFEADALRLQGRVRDADERALAAVEQAKAAGPVPTAWASASRASILVAQGRFEEGERLVREALATFSDAGHSRGTWTALPTLTAILRVQGHFTEALDLLNAQIAHARRVQEPGHTVRLLLAAARVEADLHRLGRAQEHIDEIEMLIRKGEELDLRLATAVVRGRVLIASGHLQAAAMALDETHERAKAAGLPAIAETARALRAEALAATGDTRTARDVFASAMLGLLGSGDAIALLEGASARLRALADEESPTMLGKPIQAYLRRESCATVRVEQQLAAARHAHSRGQRSEARSAALEAQSQLDALAERLDDTDRAALRLHPWSRLIRTILK